MVVPGRGVFGDGAVAAPRSGATLVGALVVGAGRCCGGSNCGGIRFGGRHSAPMQVSGGGVVDVLSGDDGVEELSPGVVGFDGFFVEDLLALRFGSGIGFVGITPVAYAPAQLKTLATYSSEWL